MANKDLVNSIRERLQHLIYLIVEFRYNEALALYYDDNFICVENEDPPTVGLIDYKKKGERFNASIKNYRARPLNLIASENMSVVEWHYQFDHTEWGRWDKVQLSVQRWTNGKIVHEHHLYGEFKLTSILQS